MSLTLARANRLFHRKTPPDVPSISNPNKPSASNLPGNPHYPQQFDLMVVVCFVCIVAVLLVAVVYLFRQRKLGSFNDDVVRFGEVEIV